MKNETKVFIIAEAGVNHGGSLSKAKELVDVAADSGADAVKFQTFQSRKLVSRFAEKAEYQIQQTGGGSQLDLLQRLELTIADYDELFQHCLQRKIEFLSTPFDIESAHFLSSRFNMRVLKIPSGEITNGPFLLDLARIGKPIILSTGMSTLDEVRGALKIIAYGFQNAENIPSDADLEASFNSQKGKETLKQNVSLLHCTTEYPAPFEDVNLLAMSTLKTEFGLQVGLSDHSIGCVVPIAAVALGAKIVEKHFTLDKNTEGPDHKASLEPRELADMIHSIRVVELSLGSGLKKPMMSEIKNISIARRSLVAEKVILKGEVFTRENLTCKRPGSGISPMKYWEYLGKSADRNYSPDELIQ